MDAYEMKVRLRPDETADVIEDKIVNGSISGTMIDKYVRQVEGHTVMTLVFEKYFMRNSSRASLTVTLDDFLGHTQVHVVGSGGGQGVFLKFDWGASDSFSMSVEEALADYRV